ncbi:hypothetical protein EYS14_13200 [Alteromonadaceae bacterium M269]|nr:hypothetical protein EYS14_13200 [Alteromonadaceae bacterium M269]
MSQFAKWRLGFLLSVMMLIVVALIIVPLPKLITYKHGNGVSSSIYWRGFGEYGQLLDSNAEFVKLDMQTQHLHICHNLETGIHCQPFKIVEVGGPFSVLSQL